jgi:hypothetical protein
MLSFMGSMKAKENGSSHNPNYVTMKDVSLEVPHALERENTADVVNDPRLYVENVLDKRLAAFEALAIVTEIMSAEAVKQCFELPADFELVGPYWHVAIFQVIGFGIMISVLFMTTVATATLSLQLFFSIRLMTAGPTGFDKAASFYTDRRMWQWRERAVFGVKWGIVGFFLSTGFMLYVKLYTEGAPETTVEHDEEEGRHSHKIFAGVTLGIFLILSAALTHLVQTHTRVFEECYASVDMCHPSGLTGYLRTEKSS